MFLTFCLFNVPGCCVHELLCDDVCCAMRLFVFEFVFNVFVWFVCDSLCDVVWSVLSCFCCAACYFSVRACALRNDCVYVCVCVSLVIYCVMLSVCVCCVCACIGVDCVLLLVIYRVMVCVFCACLSVVAR